MNRTDPTRPGQTATLFDGLFLKKIKATNVNFWLNLHSHAFFGNVAISVIFSSFFIKTINWKENFEFWWFHRKYLIQIYQNIYTLFRIRKYFFIYRNEFLVDKCLVFFCSFQRITSIVHWICKFWWLHRRTPTTDISTKCHADLHILRTGQFWFFRNVST